MAEINEVIFRQVKNDSITGSPPIIKFAPVIFKTFADTITPVFDIEQSTVGQQDPSVTYKLTTREIQCDFVHVSQDNREIEKLMKLMYAPKDSNGENLNSLAAKFNVSLGKFIADPVTCYLKSVKYSYPNPNTLAGYPKVLDGVVTPRYYEVSLNLTVLTLGEVESGKNTIGMNAQGNIVGRLWR